VDQRKADAVRLNGFLMMLFALLQGVFILAAIGAPASQGRAHIEIFIFSFVTILIGMNAPSMKLSSSLQTVLFYAAPTAAWLGIAHAVGVASFSAVSIHQTGTASAAVEGALKAIGGISAVLSLTSLILVVRGLTAARRR
jgi:hypothetical protein